jgi:hypothetical protein
MTLEHNQWRRMSSGLQRRSFSREQVGRLAAVPSLYRRFRGERGRKAARMRPAVRRHFVDLVKDSRVRAAVARHHDFTTAFESAGERLRLRARKERSERRGRTAHARSR